MLRTILTPDHANIEFAIPESYVGKKLEVLVYTVDEIQTEPAVGVLAEPKKPSDFKGILRSDIVDEFQDYIKKSREEWQQRI